MKTALMALGLVNAQVPIPTHTPGWQIGNPVADIEIRFFYDLLCPASKASHYQFKPVLDMDSTFPGKKWRDVLNVKVTPVVLPYHLHSYQVTQVVPYLFDVCAADQSKCSLLDSYAELAWANLDWIVDDTAESEVQFEAKWAGMINQKFPEIPTNEIMGLFQNGTHNTDQRVRGYWKYATSIDINATPSVYMNGVNMGGDAPYTTQDWTGYLTYMYPAQKEDEFLQ